MGKLSYEELKKKATKGVKISLRRPHNGNFVKSRLLILYSRGLRVSILGLLSIRRITFDEIIISKCLTSQLIKGLAKIIFVRTIV
jgi:hypothetical protein